ncbi:hypothetical protein TWF694_006641 [Orbilia ellipsospora]|uniref:Uncharacterized protein n=1 Tax=Orbilia ellipsospora TaxID=2528407 RepID=A0AAV9XM93_9PEZI
MARFYDGRGYSAPEHVFSCFVRIYEYINAQDPGRNYIINLSLGWFQKDLFLLEEAGTPDEKAYLDVFHDMFKDMIGEIIKLGNVILVAAPGNGRPVSDLNHRCVVLDNAGGFVGDERA